MNYLKTSLLLAALTALFLAAGYALGGQGGMQIALLFALGTNFFAYWFSDSAVLRMYGARPIEDGQVHEIVARLAERAGLPMPKVYVIDTMQPNAFATGRNPDHAAVAVTKGITQLLTPRELAGVIAHELGHIKNRDTLIMTVTATIAGALGMLAQFAFFFGGRRDDRQGSMLGSIAIMILAPLTATLVQLAISRTREYAADRMGAEISQDPIALASALEKIQHDACRVDNNVAEQNPSTAHMFIINPLHTHSMDNLFTTHPKTENRIRALQQLAATIISSPVMQEEEANPSGPWG